MPYRSTSAPILYSHGKLLIPCTITQYQREYRDYPSALSVDLSTKKVTYLSVFPEPYSKAYWGTKFKYEPSIAYNHTTEKLGERFFSSKVYDPSKIFLSPNGINLFRWDLHEENENKVANKFLSRLKSRIIK